MIAFRITRWQRLRGDLTYVYRHAKVSARAAALRAFRGLPHRVSLVGEAEGVRWYDDSKATVPHATVAALSAFDRERIGREQLVVAYQFLQQL